MANELKWEADLDLNAFKTGLDRAIDEAKESGTRVERILEHLGVDIDEEQFESGLNEMESEYGQFVRKIEANDADIDLDTKKAKAKQKGLNQTTGRSTEALHKLKSAATLAGAALATGLAVGAAKATQSFMKFERGLSRINTIANVSDSRLEGLGKGLNEISTQVGTAMPQLQKGTYQALSRGIEFGNTLEFIEQTAKAAKGGTTDLRSTVRSTTTVLNAFNMNGDKTQQILDTMFATVEKGGTSFEELSKHIADVAPIAASAGVDFKEVGTAIATITKQGTPTSKATTQIKRAILSLNDTLGEGWSKTMTLQEGMQKMVEKAEKSDKSLKELAGRVQGYQGILQLTGDSADIYIDAQGRIQEATGATQSAYENMADDLQHESKKMKTSFSSLGRTFVTEVGHLFEGGIKNMTGFAKAAEEAISSEKDLSTQLKNNKENMNALFESIQETNEGSDRRKRLIKKLNENYGKYLENQVTEKDNYQDIEEAQRKANKAMQERISQVMAEEEIKKTIKQNKNLEKNIDKFQEKADKAFVRLRESIQRYNERTGDSMTVQKALNDLNKQSNSIILEKIGKYSSLGTEIAGNADIYRNLSGELKHNKQRKQEVKEKIQQLKQQYNDLVSELMSASDKTEKNSEKTEEQAEKYTELSRAIDSAETGLNKFADYENEKISAPEVEKPEDPEAPSFGQPEDLEMSWAEEFQGKMHTLNDATAKWAKNSRDTVSAVDKTVGSIKGLYDQLYQHRKTQIENQKEEEIQAAQSEYQARKKEIKNSISSEKKRRKKLAQLEQSHQARINNIKEEARQKELKAKKKMKPIKIAQAISNTALGVTQALANLPPPASWIVAAATAAAGAAEVATIRAQKYATGGPVKGPEQLIRVNEEGEEYVMDHETTRTVGADALARIQQSPEKARQVIKSTIGVDKPPKPQFAFATGGSTTNVENSVNPQGVNQRLDNIEEAIVNIQETIQGANFNFKFDPEKLATVVEDGQKKLKKKEM